MSSGKKVRGRKAFSWLLINILTGFAVMLAVQGIVLSAGLQQALSRYSINQLREKKAIARNILVNPDDFQAETLEYSSPFFVFRADKTLLYSNRGKGRSIPEQNLREVAYEGRLIGYFYTDQIRFNDNQSNRIFLSTLLFLIVVSIFLSLAIAVFLSIYTVRRITRPLTEISTEIGKLHLLKPLKPAGYSIQELEDISREVESVSRILSSQEEYKREWMQDMAHDLRTPVSGLKMQLEGIADGVLEPTPERINDSIKEVERLEKMINDISILYTLEKSGIPEKKEIDAGSFLSDLADAFSMQADKKKIIIKTENKIRSLNGDRALLFRAAGNLIQNAINYSPEKTEIEIKISEADNEVKILVSDQGPGIPDNQREKIFNRFYRGDYARQTPGTGLGLNIAREILTRHSGRIEIERNESSGCRFVLVIPI